MKRKLDARTRRIRALDILMTRILPIIVAIWAVFLTLQTTEIHIGTTVLWDRLMESAVPILAAGVLVAGPFARLTQGTDTGYNRIWRQLVEYTHPIIKGITYGAGVFAIFLIGLGAHHATLAYSDLHNAPVAQHGAHCTALLAQRYSSRYSRGGVLFIYRLSDGTKKVQNWSAQRTEFWESGFGARLEKACDNKEEPMTVMIWPATGLIADVIPSQQ